MDRNADVLWFSKKAKRLPTPFSTNSRIFNPSKRGSEIPYQPAVDPYDSSVDFSRYTMRFDKVICPNG